MRILHCTPGTGSFHCGSCLRDHALTKALRQRGHDALMVPLYLPPVLDDITNEDQVPVFFGGINAFLQQKLSLFRKTPRWLDKLLDHSGLLRFSSKFAGMTKPEDLGAMTVSMLKGEEGLQKKELDRLVDWLVESGKPDVLCLSNVLLVGMARTMKERLSCPIFCVLQGEDSFLDSLPEPYREQAWSELRTRCAELDGFLPVSRSYGELMTKRLGLKSERVHVLHNGIDVSDYVAKSLPHRPTLGYLARLCPPKGFHRAVDAFLNLHRRGRVEGLRLLAVGACTPEDEEYVAAQLRRIDKAGLSDLVELRKNVSREDKLEALQRMSVLSVPALYGESFGLYLLEALAMGRPFVQPRHGAFPELHELTEGGLLFDHEEPGEHVMVLESLLRDRSRIESLGQRGRERVHARFTVGAMADSFLEIMADLEG